MDNCQLFVDMSQDSVEKLQSSCFLRNRGNLGQVRLGRLGDQTLGSGAITYPERSCLGEQESVKNFEIDGAVSQLRSFEILKNLEKNGQKSVFSSLGYLFYWTRSPIFGVEETFLFYGLRSKSASFRSFSKKVDFVAMIQRGDPLD